VSLAEIASIALAGLAAGAVNTLVGSGTLITFPVLLAWGYAPVTANVSNSVGLAPGSVSGAIGYRRELAGQRDNVLRLGAMSALGGMTGAVLLLLLPASAFKAIVPGFIALALVLVLLQPRLDRWLRERRIRLDGTQRLLVLAAVYATGVYGGYFGAAQGILLLAVLGLGLPEGLQRVNAVKNVLAGLVNLVAAVVFVLAAHIAWDAAALIAVGAFAGGVVGARVGRRLPPGVLRAVIVVVGVSAIAQLVL
jgi:uncharacterized membrane protein YfcA